MEESGDLPLDGALHPIYITRYNFVAVTFEIHVGCSKKPVE